MRARGGTARPMLACCDGQLHGGQAQVCSHMPSCLVPSMVQYLAGHASCQPWSGARLVMPRASHGPVPGWSCLVPAMVQCPAGAAEKSHKPPAVEFATMVQYFIVCLSRPTQRPAASHQYLPLLPSLPPATPNLSPPPAAHPPLPSLLPPPPSPRFPPICTTCCRASRGSRPSLRRTGSCGVRSRSRARA